MMTPEDDEPLRPKEEGMFNPPSQEEPVGEPVGDWMRDIDLDAPTLEGRLGLAPTSRFTQASQRFRSALGKLYKYFQRSDTPGINTIFTEREIEMMEHSEAGVGDTEVLIIDLDDLRRRGVDARGNTNVSFRVTEEAEEGARDYMGALQTAMKRADEALASSDALEGELANSRSLYNEYAGAADVEDDAVDELFGMTLEEYNKMYRSTLPGGKFSLEKKAQQGESKTPEGESKTPEGESKTPQGESKTPQGESKTPQGESKTPDEDPLPQGETKAAEEAAEEVSEGASMAEESAIASKLAAGMKLTPAMLGKLRLGGTILFSAIAGINLGIMLGRGDKFDTLEVINQVNAIAGGPAILLIDALAGAASGGLATLASMGVVGVYAALRMGERDKQLNDARSNFSGASYNLYNNLTSKAANNIGSIVRAKRRMNDVINSTNSFGQDYYKYVLKQSEYNYHKLKTYTYHSDLRTQQVSYDQTGYFTDDPTHTFQRRHMSYNLLPYQQQRGRTSYDKVDYAPYRTELNKMTGLLARQLNIDAYNELLYARDPEIIKQKREQYNSQFQMTKKMLQYQLMGELPDNLEGIRSARVRNPVKEQKMIQLYNLMNENDLQNQHIRKLFDGYDSNHKEQSTAYNTRLALMTNDPNLLHHYKAQALLDPNYQKALTDYTKAMNRQFAEYWDDRIKQKVAKAPDDRKEIVRRQQTQMRDDLVGNPRYTLKDSDVAHGLSIRDTGLSQIHTRALALRMKRVGFSFPHLPFWVQYYQRNQRKYKQQDATMIALLKNKEHIKPAGKPIWTPGGHSPDETGEGDKPGSADAPRPHQGSHDSRPIDPVKPVPAPPPAPIHDHRGQRRRRIHPFTLKEGRAKYRTVSLDNDFLGVGGAHDEVIRIYDFDFLMAHHLLEIACATYGVSDTSAPTFDGYDAVSGLGHSGQSAQGLALYNSQEDVIVISLKGTDAAGDIFNVVRSFFTMAYRTFKQHGKTQAEFDMPDIIGRGMARKDEKAAMRDVDVIQHIINNMTALYEHPHPGNFFSDMLTNMNFQMTTYFGLLVHKGFADYADSLFEDVLQFITEHDTGQTSFIFTGHSMGGAAADILKHRFVMERILSSRNRLSYTFGGPRWCHSSGVDAFNMKNPNTFRVTQTDDLIVHLPPSRFGYKHVGLEYSLFSITPLTTKYFSENSGKYNIYDYGVDSREDVPYAQIISSFINYGMNFHGCQSYNMALMEAINMTTDNGISHQYPYKAFDGREYVTDEEGRRYNIYKGVIMDEEGVSHTPQFFMGNIHLQSIPKNYIMGFYMYKNSEPLEGIVAFK